MLPPTCSILCIGDELVLGLIGDGNGAWLCRELTSMGWHVRSVRLVGDAEQTVVEALRQEASATDLLLVTGGLGPTADDRTRQALATVLGTELEERPALLEEIRAYFELMQRPMRDSNRIQANIPRGAESISNACGTAPGIACRIGQCQVFSMPGVPHEMQAMFNNAVRPYAAEKTGGTGNRMRELRLFGIGESTVGELLRQEMAEDGNPLVGTMVSAGIITVRLLARDADPAAADQTLEAAESVVRERLGEHVFGVGQQSLASVVVQTLHEREATLACAESCTGGMISSHIVDVAGASSVLLESIVCYSNDAKSRRLGLSPLLLSTRGAVSRDTALTLARSVRSTAGATVGLSVTGIAGPEGGTIDKPVGTTWMAVASADDAVVLHRRFGNDRYQNRLRATNTALDLLRRFLMGLPLPEEAERVG